MLASVPFGTSSDKCPVLSRNRASAGGGIDGDFHVGDSAISFNLFDYVPHLHNRPTVAGVDKWA